MHSNFAKNTSKKAINLRTPLMPLREVHSCHSVEDEEHWIFIHWRVKTPRTTLTIDVPLSFLYPYFSKWVPWATSRSSSILGTCAICKGASSTLSFFWITALHYWFDFCHTSTWISHKYTYVPSLSNHPPTSHPFPPTWVWICFLANLGFEFALQQEGDLPAGYS